MSLATAVSGPSPFAMPRIARSRSVTTPTIFPAPSTTGSDPQSVSCITRATRSAESVTDAHVGLEVIMSLAFMAFLRVTAHVRICHDRAAEEAGFRLVEADRRDATALTVSAAHFVAQPHDVVSELLHRNQPEIS